VTLARLASSSVRLSSRFCAGECGHALLFLLFRSKCSIRLAESSKAFEFDHYKHGGTVLLNGAICRRHRTELIPQCVGTGSVTAAYLVQICSFCGGCLRQIARVLVFRNVMFDAKKQVLFWMLDLRGESGPLPHLSLVFRGQIF
jgi:hypothetical protein